jgi:folylpolyglutamate synthase
MTLGLYTSPHLVAVRERLRINGSPLSEEDFTKYFFQVWDRLQENTTVGLSCLYIYFFQLNR